MKKNKIIVLLIILLACTFTACSNANYKINFIVDGTIVHSINTKGGEAIILPEEPSKDGFEFAGWFLSEEFKGEPLTKDYFVGIDLSYNISVYAKWKPVTVDKDPTYTITFNSNDGSFVDALTQKAGTTIVAPTTQKSGFDFGGWYTDNGTFNNAYTFTVMPQENITLYAKWTPVNLETIVDLRFETDDTFEVSTQNSVKYNFEISDFFVFQLLIISDNHFNAVLTGVDGEIKSYQSDRISDSLLLENGDYSLIISKHDQDTAVTTNISYQEIVTDGEINLNQDNSLCLLRFNISEEYDYNVILSMPSEDILYNVYDEYGVLIYENQRTGEVQQFYIGDYYFLFHNQTEYIGKATIIKKSQARNTSKENSQPLTGLTAATGQIDVPNTQLYYSFTVENDGSLIVVHAFAENNKYITVNVTDSNDKAVIRAGSKSASNPSSSSNFNNEAKGEYVLPKGTYYLRVALGTGVTGSFSISAGTPSITNTYVGATHSFDVNPNTTYYFRVYVPEKTYICFNTYRSDNEDRYFPFYYKTIEENGVKYYTRAYNASMFTGENHTYTLDGHMLTGYSEVNSKDIHDNPNLARGYSSKSDYYYICIRAYANADGGYITLHVENKEPS